MTKHKISIKPPSYGPHAMIAYEHVQEVGIQYLEVEVPGNPALLKDMLADKDLDFKIGSFVFSIETDDPTVVDRFKQACEICKDFEFEFFFCSTKTKGKYKKMREPGYAVLRQLGEIAQQYGKFLSLETHPPFCVNADEMLKTMKGVNHPAVKINFDTANIYYYNKLQPGEGITEMEKVIDYIGSMHLKETNGKYKTWFFPALGAEGGIVDYKKIYDILDKAGFDGISTLEIEGTKKVPMKSLNMEQAKDVVAKSMEHLRSLDVA